VLPYSHALSQNKVEGQNWNGQYYFWSRNKDRAARLLRVSGLKLQWRDGQGEEEEWASAKTECF